MSVQDDPCEKEDWITNSKSYLSIVLFSPVIHICYFIISQVPVFVSSESKQLIFLKSTKKPTLRHPEALFSSCWLMQPPLTRGNNNTQCRETAPRLFPSLDKAVATTEQETGESFLHPRDTHFVRRSCAFGANTCPIATHELLLQFPVYLPLITCPRWFPRHIQCIVCKI